MKDGIPPLQKHQTILPSGWVWATADQIRTMAAHALGIGPFGSDLKVSDYTDSGCPLIFVRNIRSGCFDGMGSKFVSVEKETALKAHIALPGDVLVTKMGDPPGDASIYPSGRPPGIITADCIRLRVDPRIAAGAYVVFAIGTRVAQQQIQEMTTGVAQQKISLEKFRGLSIPLAPLSEQHRIVDEVEKQFTRLDAAGAALLRVKANLKRYRASVLKAACEGRLVSTEADLARREGQSFETGEALLKRILKERRTRWEADQLAKMKAAGKVTQDSAWKRAYREPAPPVPEAWWHLPTGWTWATAEALSDETRSITYGVIKLGEECSGGIPTLRSSNVRPLRLDLDVVKRVAPGIAADYERTLLRGSEVLVTVRGTLGGVAVAPESCHGYNISREVAMLALVDESMGSLIAEFIASRPLDSWLRRNARGITYMGVNIEALKRLPIPLPPLAEQHRIAAEVERRLSVVDELEATVEKNIARCARLRQSILKMAFEGRLVPQDPNDEPASVLLERIRSTRAAGAVSSASPSTGRRPGRKRAKNP